MVKLDRNARELIAGVVIVCAIALGLLFAGWHDDHVSNKAHDGWPVYRCRNVLPATKLSRWRMADRRAAGSLLMHRDEVNEMLIENGLPRGYA